jgi:hypothetical protein
MTGLASFSPARSTDKSMSAKLTTAASGGGAGASSVRYSSDLAASISAERMPGSPAL